MESPVLRKICSLNEAIHQVARYHLKSEVIVFTNGCFDILHPGHIAVLSAAKSMGTKLIVGLNSDASVKRLKGASRPVQNENSRALLLAALVFVDMVVIFEEDTPLDLIQTLQPQVLVKGGDYNLGQIVGAKEVLANGGRVEIVPIEEGHSTTGILSKV